jgi:hypothetical protein
VLMKCVLGTSLEGGERQVDALEMLQLFCESVRLMRGAW